MHRCAFRKSYKGHRNHLQFFTRTAIYSRSTLRIIMQFTRLASLAAIITLAVATPTRRTGQPASQCTTAPIQCCDSVETADSPSASKVLAGLGIVVQDVIALVGLTCTPISVIGVGGNSCSANPVCCENNSFNGVVSLGCVPVDLSL
ncbi:hypothetical protein VKT23_013343 [Stygiomarasmius scandens]|uniref:Hydrophobin n=1 Tax=Marasmiellus scandens TaxID=2682957 RepID=A0ABR1J3I5_9AGAR